MIKTFAFIGCHFRIFPSSKQKGYEILMDFLNKSFYDFNNSETFRSQSLEAKYTNCKGENGQSFIFLHDESFSAAAFTVKCILQ